jgi:hypothetical protein
MAGRLQPQPHVADVERFAPTQRLLRLARATLTEPGRHQGESVGARQHAAVSRSGVVGMRMGDHRAVHRSQRIDEEPARFAPEPLRQDFQPCRRVRH